jgi:mRNA-degrading endonuclease RelE of RelBE toxin-antitoxin system
MKVFYTDEFAKQYKKLPERVQEAYLQQEEIIKENPFDSRLHAKPLKGYDGIFSFRVTRVYRVLFKISENTIVICLTIAHRKDVYR